MLETCWTKCWKNKTTKQKQNNVDKHKKYKPNMNTFFQQANMKNNLTTKHEKNILTQYMGIVQTY